VRFQSVAKAQDIALIHVALSHDSEVPKQRHIVQSLFHGGIAERELLQHEVNAQQHLNGRRWPTPVPFRDVRCNQRHQVFPQYSLLHLLEKFALAGFLGGEVPSALRRAKRKNQSMSGGPFCSTLL